MSSIILLTEISQGPIECYFMISDEERESNEFQKSYTIGEIFESDCMNDDIHVIGSAVTPSTDRSEDTKANRHGFLLSQLKIYR